MNSKAQVSMEFLIIVILLIGILLFSLSVFAEKNQGLILSMENYEAQLIADQIAEKTNAVYAAGNGTETTIRLKQIEGFTPSINGNAVRVSWRDNFVDSALITSNVRVNNIAIGQEIKIENINEEIIIDFV